MALGRFSNRDRGGSQMLGSLHEPVVFEVPGGEGDSPEQQVTPTVRKEESPQSISPLHVILVGAVALVVSVFGLRKLLD